MAYTKTDWKNREVERPRTYVMTENADGTVTLTPSEGTVFAAGTPIDSTNMNKIEDQLAANDAALDTKLDKAGGELTGALLGTVINAGTLQQGGTDLSQIFQPKGNYQPAGAYVVGEYSASGIRLNCGKFAGTGKPIILYLSSSQPQPDANEHRVWIQIDNF